MFNPAVERRFVADEVIEEKYPLTSLQEGMLFNEARAPGSGVDVVQIVCRLRERLDPALLGRAWQSVLDGNPQLRASFDWSGEEGGRQAVHRSVTGRVTVVDWTGLSDAESGEALARYREEERRSGFRLDAPPLIRLTLFQPGTGGSVLLCTRHHILLDGYSSPLMLGELFSAYDALRAGRPVSAVTRVPFRAYVEWLRDHDPPTAQTFWQSYLRGFDQATPLPHESGAVPPAGTFACFGREERQLPSATLSALDELARASGARLSTVFHAAWGILLSRASDRPDVVFGETRACRRSTIPGAEEMLGCCINTVPLNVSVGEEMVLGDWLRGLAEEHDRLREHERSSLPQIRTWHPMPGEAPLFESLLVYNRQGLDGAMKAACAPAGGGSFTVYSHTNFPLALEVHGDDGALTLTYRTDRYTAATASRLIAHLVTILECMARGGDQRVGAISLLRPDEEEQIVRGWNDTRVTPSSRRCLHDLIADQARKTPHAVAVRCGAETLSYRELNRRADLLAVHLASFGVGPGSVVGIAVGRSCAMLVSLLGILKSGAAYLPLDPSLPAERLLFMLSDARARLIVTSRSIAGTFASAPASLICHEDVPVVPDSPDLPRGASPEDPAYLIYTSGSTGRPKGVLILHRGLTNYVLWSADAYGVAGGCGSLVHTPLAFDLTVTGLYAPLVVGREVHLLPEESGPEALAEALEARRGYSFVKMTPAHLDLLSSLVPPGRGGGFAAAFVLGGEVLRGESLLRWRDEAPGTAIFNEYGPTETSVGCSVFRVPPELPLSGPVPIGRPIANTRLYILDRSMRPVPPGMTGELCIAGAGVARGYVNQPALNREKFLPDPFSGEGGERIYRSGDIARFLPDGTIEYVGRADDQVKIRGYRIEPAEIESVLARCNGLRAAAVVLRESAPGGSRLEAYCVKGRAEPPTADEIRAHARRFLPEYMLPALFVLLDELPLNSRGKVDRKALLTMGETADAAQEVAGRGMTPLESSLAEIWTEVLGVRVASPRDNFFERGGHSLLVMRLLARIQARWGVSLRISDLFGTPALASLAAVIERKLREEVEVMPEEEPPPKSAAEIDGETGRG